MIFFYMFLFQHVLFYQKEVISSLYATCMSQDFEENPSIIFESSLPRGVILPHSSEALPVFLKAKDVGRCHRTLRIAVFGSTQPPLVSQVIVL